MNLIFAIIIHLIVYYMSVLGLLKLLKLKLDWHVPITITIALLILSILSYITNLPLMSITFIIIIYILKYVQEVSWRDTLIITIVPFILSFLPLILLI